MPDKPLTTPSELLLAQAAAGFVMLLALWLVALIARFLGICHRGSGNDELDERGSKQHGVTPDNFTPMSSDNSSEGGFDDRDGGVCELAVGSGTMTIQNFAALTIVALCVAGGSLTAHTATMLLAPAHSQLLKGWEIIFSLAFSYAAGLPLGGGSAALYVAAVLALTGGVLSSWAHAPASGNKLTSAAGQLQGVAWALVSCAFFAARGVLYKLLRIGTDDDTALSAYTTAVLATSVSLGAAGVAIEGGADSAVARVAQALFGASPIALLSGVMWLAYQVVSERVLRRVSPAAHAVLNNAKRALVLMAVFVAFPTAVSWSPLYGLGVALMLAAAALAAYAPAASEALLSAWASLRPSVELAPVASAGSAPLPPATNKRSQLSRLAVVFVIILLGAYVHASLSTNATTERHDSRASAYDAFMQHRSLLRRDGAAVPLSAVSVKDDDAHAVAAAANGGLCSGFSDADVARWHAATTSAGMEETLYGACPALASADRSPPTVAAFSRLLVGLHVGWFGQANPGDDIMAPLFAVLFRRALLLELPHLAEADVATVIGDCGELRAMPDFASRKHFWVLGGGSVLEFTSLSRLSDTAIPTSAARGEPLYLFGPGFQVAHDAALQASWRRFFQLYRPSTTGGGAVGGGSADGGARAGGGHDEQELQQLLLWGGVRGPITSVAAGSALPADAAPLAVIGDPGFMAKLLLELDDAPAAAAAAAFADALPSPYIVSSCGRSNFEDEKLMTRTVIALAKEHNFTAVVAFVGEFAERTAAFTAAVEDMTAQGVQAVSAPLGHPHDVSTLLHVLRGAAAGLHCTLHGTIMQMAMERPAFGLSGLKFLDGPGGAGLTGLQLLHKDVPDFAFKVVDAIAQADRWAAAMRAHNELVLERHTQAMRRFVRHLIWRRYPDVGRILSCALQRSPTHSAPGTAAAAAANRPRLEIRSYLASEGAVIDLVLRGGAGESRLQ